MGDSIAEKIAELKARKDKLFQERTEKAGRQFEANKEIGELTGELLVLFALPDLAIEPEILWSFYLRLATECDLRIYYGMGGPGGAWAEIVDWGSLEKEDREYYSELSRASSKKAPDPDVIAAVIKLCQEDREHFDYPEFSGDIPEDPPGRIDAIYSRLGELAKVLASWTDKDYSKSSRESERINSDLILLTIQAAEENPSDSAAWLDLLDQASEMDHDIFFRGEEVKIAHIDDPDLRAELSGYSLGNPEAVPERRIIAAAARVLREEELHYRAEALRIKD